MNVILKKSHKLLSIQIQTVDPKATQILIIHSLLSILKGQKDPDSINTVLSIIQGLIPDDNELKE